MCLDLCVGCLVGLRLSLKGALVYPAEQDPSCLKGVLLAQTPGGGGGLCSVVDQLY